MAFALDDWKEQARQKLTGLGAWLKSHGEREAPYLTYGALSAMSLWPLVEAAQSGQLLPVGMALGSVAGAVGGNLLAEQVQYWADRADTLTKAEVAGWVADTLPDQPALREALDAILAELEAISTAEAGLPETDRTWFRQALRVELGQLGSPLIAHLSGSGMITQESSLSGGDRSVVGSRAEGDINTGDRVFDQREQKVEIQYNAENINVAVAEETARAFLAHLTPSAPAVEDLRPATERYLSHLLDRYRHLDFRGMGISDRVPLRLPLVELYVPLAARIELPRGETWARELFLAGRHASQEEEETIGRRLSDPQPVLNLLNQHDGLIILGDPGAGKTTFLKYLALRLAAGAGETLGLGQRLPILLPLSAYANALAEEDIPLDRFIGTYYYNLGIDLPLGPMLAEVLKQGQALLLLDGLDEVRDLGRRRVVVDRLIDFFVFHRKAGNKFIFTSRIVGYREVRPTIEGLAECTLVDFDRDEIEEFVEKWTTALERAAQGETVIAAQDASRERDELLAAVDRNPGVRRLAANPLLLTILALMKRQGVILPERRVELYQKYIETLLKHWNLARGLGRPPSRDLDVVETVKVLAPLALWMHQTSPGVGLVKREDVRRELEEIYARLGDPAPEGAARQFLADVREHAGLLLERGAGQYGFIHLTFQEYLAAVAVARLGQQSVEPAVAALTERLGDDNWREVILLTVGYMGIIQQRDWAAGEMVLRLMEGSPQTALLAGEAVIDAWPGGVPRQTKTHVTQVLSRMMTAARKHKPYLRATMGNVVARLGDLRPGVGLRADGLPDIVWCDVPAGPFLMGSAPERDSNARGNEQPQHSVDLPTYRISRFPVTNAQYAAFVEDGGYSEKWRQCWTEAGWIWKEGRHRPKLVGGDFDLANHPVVAVSWYEAVAFCHWLTLRLREVGDLGAVATISLPSEREWEKAARGTDGRLYPWGDEMDANRANYRDTRFSATSTVGTFPGGQSPYGCEEMSGNVFEWCRTEWQENYKDYEDSDDLEGNALRVIRGGSFDYERYYARCGFRDVSGPRRRHFNRGFRVTVSPNAPLLSSGSLYSDYLKAD